MILGATINSGRQFIIFSLIGIVNSLIHYSVFLALYKIFGFQYLVSSGIGYFCGLVNSYFLNRKLTFRMDRKRNVSEFSRFVAVNVVSLGVNLSVMGAFVEILRVAPEVSQVFAIVASVVVNFTGNKFWTFVP